MVEYTNSTNLNARSGKGTSAIFGKAVKILPTRPRSNVERSPRVCCPKCKSQVIVDERDFLDLNQKRHFCEGADRIPHEEKCVIEIQRILEYYNRHELSSFQLGLKMDD
jgi:hypothetical protein